MTMENEVQRDSSGINKELQEKLGEYKAQKQAEKAETIEAIKRDEKETKKVKLFRKLLDKWWLVMTFVGWFYSEGLIQMAVGSNDTVNYSLGLLAVAHVAAYDVSHRTRNPMHITVYWSAKWAGVPCHMVFGMNLLLTYFLGMYLYENVGLDIKPVLTALGIALFVIPYLIAPFFKFCKTYHKFGSEESFDHNFMSVVYIPIHAFFGKMLIVDTLLGYDAFPSIYDWYWLPYGTPDLTIEYLERISSAM